MISTVSRHIFLRNNERAWVAYNKKQSPGGIAGLSMKHFVDEIVHSVEFF
ncbi:uncharacterized protein METZ01_LOCUS402469, partial [marine metagenome]